MKISDRTHPIIKAIKNNFADGIAHPKEFETSDDVKTFLVNDLDETVLSAKKSIKILTTPFFEAYRAAYLKLSSTLVEEPEPQSGVIVIGSVIFIYRLTEDFISLYILVWNKHHHLPEVSFEAVTNRKDNTFIGYQSEGILNLIGDRIKNLEGDTYQNSHFVLMEDIRVLLLFIKYAEIEVKFVNANSKVKDINCKYVNDTRSDIQILDSTWFTTLVHSEAFKVRGHFRLQPYKDSKKLIWINEFQKNGYTRNFKRPLVIHEQ